MTSVATGETRRGSRCLLFLPIIAFAALAALFFIRLYAGDASLLPSALIGRPVPSFNLPPLEGMSSPGLSDADLRQGRVSVVNVFASWCVPCHAEHSVLMELARDPQLQDRVALFGLAYKDQPENTRRFLGQGGNPFARIGVDASGRTAIDFGVYGVPETYVIKSDGTIAYRFVGPLSQESLRQVLLPQIIAASH
ncbi:MAG: DsbE family thiol:disulfide interchange protein [Methylobacteriaceae bacterium]|nr:DsbE family thiol:disulfide interchange protein [Methylobacteriaceae bacterium]